MEEEDNFVKNNFIDNNKEINIEKNEEDIMSDIDKIGNKMQEIYKSNEINIQFIEKNEYDSIE